MVLSWVEGDWIPTSKQIGERRGKGEKGGKKKTRKNKKRGEAPPSKDEESDHHEPSLRSGSGDAVFYRSLHIDSGTNSVAGGCFRKLNSRPLTFTLELLNETSTSTANFVVESSSARASCSC